MNVRIMADSPIRFPGLFGDWAFTGSSVAFHIGGKAIYWYGIIIALGVLLALCRVRAAGGAVRVLWRRSLLTPHPFKGIATPVYSGALVAIVRAVAVVGGPEHG